MMSQQCSFALNTTRGTYAVHAACSPQNSLHSQALCRQQMASVGPTPEVTLVWKQLTQTSGGGKLESNPRRFGAFRKWHNHPVEQVLGLCNIMEQLDATLLKTKLADALLASLVVLEGILCALLIYILHIFI